MEARADFFTFPTSIKNNMSISLQAISIAELNIFATSGTPEGVASRAAQGALPPPHVAIRSLSQMAEGKSAFWCSTFYMVRNTDGLIVGSCGFKDAPLNGRIEIGYGVSPDCRKQGSATAAVSALLTLAFATGEVHEVLAQVNPANDASIGVVRKLNFVNNGLARDNHDEPLVQWLARKPSWSRSNV